jgi:hypothetical protein
MRIYESGRHNQPFTIDLVQARHRSIGFDPGYATAFNPNVGLKSSPARAVQYRRIV